MADAAQLKLVSENGARAPSHAVSTMTLARRAAIIIAVLGEAAARPIVEKLDDNALAKVNEALRDVSLMPHDVLVEIIVDFLAQLNSASGVVRDGKAQTQQIISSIVESRRSAWQANEGGDGLLPDGGESAPPGVKASVWARLESRDPEQVAAYMNHLTPNIISLILRKVSVTASSEILCFIDDEMLNPVMGYMVEGAPLDPGIDSVLSRMIEMEFLNAGQDTSEEDQEHLGAVGELLSLIPTGKRNPLMEFLKQEHEARLNCIQRSLLTFDILPEILPRNAVPVIFRDMETQDIVRLLAALQADYAPVCEFILSNISSRLADQVRDDLTRHPSLAEAEIERVQRDFLTSLMTLKRAGQIVMEEVSQETA